jgi:hypothetical protein
MYEDIATLAAAEAGWTPKQQEQQLAESQSYAESLRVR